MLNGYSGIRTRNFGLCLPSLLVGQTMTRQSWTGSLDECPDPLLDYYNENYDYYNQELNDYYGHQNLLAPAPLPIQPPSQPGNYIFVC